MLALAAIAISVIAWPIEAATGPDASIPMAVESEARNLNTAKQDVIDSLDAAMERVRVLDVDIQRLEERIEKADGLDLKVLEARQARYWRALIELVHSTAKQVLKLERAGYDVSGYREAVRNGLKGAPAAIYDELDRVRAGVTRPSGDESAAEQAMIDAEARIALDRLIRLNHAIQDNITLQRAYGLDAEADAAKTEFNARLKERAAGISDFLEMSEADLVAARTQLAVLPDDADIAALFAVARNRVSLTADALRSVVELMQEQGLDTSAYGAQLISTTGAVTADIFDIAVLRNLTAEWLDSVGDAISVNAGDIFLRALLFIAILLAFFKLAGVAQRIITKGLVSSRVQLSQLLRRMIISFTRGTIIAIGVLIALSQLGISLGPLLAGLGIAGFVVGFALQDTLSNFASGLMILIYKPFDVDDVVEVGDGVFGTVSNMSLVNTTVLTFDNQTLIVPNNNIWQKVIRNVTAQKTRRIDLNFGIGYSDDIPKAERILAEIMERHEAVLSDPEPVVRLHELGESSVNFAVRPWVKTEDYWPVYWDITRQVKLRFDAEGISIPFPQRDVHLFAESPMLTAAADAQGRQSSHVTQHRREYDTAASDAQDDD